MSASYALTLAKELRGCLVNSDKEFTYGTKSLLLVADKLVAELEREVLEEHGVDRVLEELETERSELTADTLLRYINDMAPGPGRDAVVGAVMSLIHSGK